MPRLTARPRVIRSGARRPGGSLSVSWSARSATTTLSCAPGRCAAAGRSPSCTAPTRISSSPISTTARRARLPTMSTATRSPGSSSPKGDTILFEHYQYGRTDRHRFVSQSMAKTVTAMLIGIAVAEGKIASIEDRVERYVPGLAGTEYGGTTLRSLLTMSSGVLFREDYDGADDMARLGRDLFRPESPGRSRRCASS